MRILATFPGKHGDALWALPTLRAASEAAGEPVDLLLSPAYGSAGFLALLRAQPYLGRVDVCPTWTVQNTAPMTPWSPFEETLHHEALPEGRTLAEYAQVVHLGYREWPTAPLPRYVYEIARREYPGLPLAPLDLERPWVVPRVTRPDWWNSRRPVHLAEGWTDEWFELKVGLSTLLDRHDSDWDLICMSTSPRWNGEAGNSAYSWIEAADVIRQADLFVGDCSALHVLACAVGTRVVLVEPNAMRHADVFYPYGKAGPRVRLVLGNDARPTNDARHCIDEIEAALAKRAQAAAGGQP